MSWHECKVRIAKHSGCWLRPRRGYFLMAPLFSPEFRLVAACAMWPPSDRRTEAIRTAAAGPLDWPRFLRVARRHQVIGLVHEGLTQVRPDVPPEIARGDWCAGGDAGSRESGHGP